MTEPEALEPVPEEGPEESYEISADGTIENRRATIVGRLGTARLTYEFDLDSPTSDHSGLDHIDVLIGSSVDIIKGVLDAMVEVQSKQEEA